MANTAGTEVKNRASEELSRSIAMYENKLDVCSHKTAEMEHELGSSLSAVKKDNALLTQELGRRNSKWGALSGCYGQHRRPVACSK